MRNLFKALIALLLVPVVALGDVPVAAGATSQCFQVSVLDSASTSGAGKTGLAFNTASLTCGYRRQNASDDTAITMQTSTLGTYTSGAFKEVDATTAPGDYEFCVPDAAIAAGAGVNWVKFWCGGASGMAPMRLNVNLVNGNSFGFDGKQVSESGTTLGVASGGVTADDQFNYVAEIAYFNTSGNLKAVSCIVDSVDSGDTVVTAEDISSFVANGDNYIIRANSACKSLRPTTAGNTLTVAGGAVTTVTTATTCTTCTNLTNLPTIPSNWITAAGINADALTAAKFHDDASTEFVAKLIATTIAELAAMPDMATPTVGNILRWLYQYGTGAYKTETTETEKTLLKNDGTTALGTCTVADDGTTFTRGECS